MNTNFSMRGIVEMAQDMSDTISVPKSLGEHDMDAVNELGFERVRRYVPKDVTLGFGDEASNSEAAA